MSKRSFICLKCHTSKRANAAYGVNTSYRCPICQANLIELPWNWRIPKGDDDEGWQKLAVMVDELQAEWIPHRQVIAQQKLSQIERQIERLILQKPTQLRKKKLAKLHWDMQQINDLYFERKTTHNKKSGVV